MSRRLADGPVDESNLGLIDCIWCDGTGQTECASIWCNDPDSHRGPCRHCDTTGELLAFWQEDRKRWLVKVPTWSVPHVTRFEECGCVDHRR